MIASLDCQIWAVPNFWLSLFLSIAKFERFQTFDSLWFLSIAKFERFQTFDSLWFLSIAKFERFQTFDSLCFSRLPNLTGSKLLTLLLIYYDCIIFQADPATRDGDK